MSLGLLSSPPVTVGVAVPAEMAVAIEDGVSIDPRLAPFTSGTRVDGQVVERTPPMFATRPGRAPCAGIAEAGDPAVILVQGTVVEVLSATRGLLSFCSLAQGDQLTLDCTQICLEITLQCV